MYANYEYSLTEEQQTAIRLLVLSLPIEKTDPRWIFMRKLADPCDWTESPKYTVPESRTLSRGNTARQAF